MEKIYYRGSRFEMLVPETDKIEEFMLLELKGISICYNSGYNKGYVKFIGIPTIEGHNGVTITSLRKYLENYYFQEYPFGIEKGFNSKTVKFIN